ncbi:MAG: hypothetical protein F6K56_36460 [Moorea sp. SIO3G5]|nr:hypothetical protein [Moorena sp. SIO3G5]
MPLAFPSWEGLGVGSSCLLPAPCSLLPTPSKNVPHLIEIKLIFTPP